MKAYNLTWLEERAIRQQANRWHTQQVLTDEQVGQIRQAYPVRFRQIGTALEVGSFVFTLLATLALYGLLSLVLSVDSDASGAVSLLVAGGTFAIATVIIRSNQFYRNGTDNALWLVSALSAVWGIVLLFFERSGVFPPFWQFCLIAVPILLAYIVYTGDTILGFFALSAFYGGLFDRLIDFSWGRGTIPFVFMGVSALLFAGATWLKRDRANRVYYGDVLTLVQWGTLLVGVAAGNYYVVRELNGILLGIYWEKAPQIALPELFWFITFAIPLAYGVVGFRQRNRMLLIMAAVGGAGAIATTVHYLSNWPASIILSVEGAVVIGLAVWLIRALRTPIYGFTDAVDEEPPLALIRHVGTLAAVQGTAHAQQHPDGPQFGGGEFSGGGAGDRY